MKFEEILVLVTFVIGLICLIDFIFFRKRRKLYFHAHDEGTAKEYKDPIIIEYSRSFFPILLLVLLLRSFLAEPFKIPSGSMKPTLLEGDFIVVNKFNYGLRLPIIGTKLVSIGKPKRGDIIVFHFDNNIDLIKRIVGLPGDKILYEDKVLYINGKAASQKYLGKDIDFDISGQTWSVEHSIEEINENVKHDIYKHLGVNHRVYEYNDVVVPDGHYFVIGDNRDNSVDSRFWGFVKDKDIIGRAFATWMSWDSNNKDIRWSRIGKVIN